MCIVAVKRKYENLRRLWLQNEKPDIENVLKETSHQKKKRSRRRRVGGDNTVYYCCTLVVALVIEI